mgnify:CR=1 FL=1
MGQPSDMASAVMGGMKIGEDLRNRGVRDTILRQSQQVNQMNIAQAQGQYQYKLLSSLKSVPIEQRAALFAQQMPMLEQMGIQGMPDLSDRGIEQGMMATAPFMQQDKSDIPASMREQMWQAGVLADPDADPSLQAVVGVSSGLKPRATEGSEYGQVQTMPDGTKWLRNLEENTLTPLQRIDESGNIVAMTPEEQIASRIDVAGKIAKTTAKEKGAGEEEAAVLSFKAQEERDQIKDDRMTAAEVKKQEKLAAVALQKQKDGIELSVKEKELLAEVTARVARNSAAIEIGVDAAKGLVSLRRSIALIDTITTGGWDAVSYKTRAFLGIEGADEGELANSLGKAVMSQLKDTFGAAFTAKEGDMLFAIEAGWGKSGAVNKRLLNNALAKVEGAIKRAEKRARDAGDITTADELKSQWEAMPTSFDSVTTVDNASFVNNL